MGGKVCRERDSNSHAFVGRWILSPLRLPIPPSRHEWRCGILLVSRVLWQAQFRLQEFCCLFMLASASQAALMSDY